MGKLKLASAMTLLSFSAGAVAATNPASRPVALVGAPLGAEQARLAKLAGRWKVIEKIWASPNARPVTTPGTAVFQMQLGGRHLRQDLRITSKSKSFVGLQMIGYDDIKREFFATWNDNTFNGIIVAKGAYDPTKRTYTFFGNTNDASPNKAPVPLREVMTVQDDRHFTFEYFETRNGQENRTVELTYERLS